MTTYRKPRSTLHHAAREREIRAFLHTWGTRNDPADFRANWRVYPLPRCVFAKRRARWAREGWQ